MQKSLAKNSIYNIIYTGGNIIFPFLTSIYVSRVLLPAGVGTVAYAQNIASYFVTLGALGLSSYGVREFAKVRECDKKRNKLFTELFSLNLISTSIAVIGYILLVCINNGFNGEWYLYIACGLTVFFNYINIDWLYQGMEEYGYITARSLLVKTCSFLAILLLVKTKQDYVIYALISSFGTGANYLFNVFHARAFIRFDFTELRIKRHLKSVFTIFLIIFLSTIYAKIDTTMLGAMATEESVGYYTYAQKTVNIVIMMGNAVTASLLPRLSYYYDSDRKSFYKLLDKAFQVMCVTLLPLCVGLFLVANHAVIFLYGEEFQPTALTIRLLCPLILIKGFGDLYCYQMAYASKNEKIIVPASATASAINVATNAVLIPSLMQNGAVIASVASELITNMVQFVYMKKKVKFKLNMKPLVQSIITVAAMAVCVWKVGTLNFSNTVLLALEVIVGSVVYVVLNILMKNQLMLEVINMTKQRIHNATKKRI